MLNKLCSFIKKYNMLQSRDHVVCAVSGGADSIALLFALWLLRDKLNISVSCAHFNHKLRGEESDRDEAFVRKFCEQYDIELAVGSGNVVAGKKGLEAAARDARYGFLKSLSGKIATAHTANDNTETMLMHLVRGTGLKGLGAIAPINGQLIRPMLEITRDEVLAFLDQYNLSYITDSSNETDLFLRNRLRHNVMPALMQENPRIAENLSALALRLREDAQVLDDMAAETPVSSVAALRQMPAALRNRALGKFLEDAGVPEPEAEHIGLLENIVFSNKPSAKANFPGNVIICRQYDCLVKQEEEYCLAETKLPSSGGIEFPKLGLRIACDTAQTIVQKVDCFCVNPVGKIVVRGRKAGDKITLSGGTKTLKKLFIDKKIPAEKREQIPVIADDLGVIAVCGFGVDQKRAASTLPAVQISVEEL